QVDELAKVSLFVVGVMIFFAAIFVILQAEEHWKDVQWIRELSLESTRPGLIWIDVHASRDPVPNGVMSPDGGHVATKELRVVNLGSLSRDHTSYWQNRVEFVPIVLRAVGEAANVEFFASGDQDRIVRASTVHQRNVRWLSVTMLTTVASVVLVPLLFWRQLRA